MQCSNTPVIKRKVNINKISFDKIKNFILIIALEYVVNKQKYKIYLWINYWFRK